MENVHKTNVEPKAAAIAAQAIIFFFQIGSSQAITPVPIPDRDIVVG
ncbi:MAG: hypothetical protein R2825_00715 [Saprospiraceae bacterium]